VFEVELAAAVEDATVAGRCREDTVRIEARSNGEELRTDDRLSCARATSKR